MSVSDTGAGIAPEHLPHVFERFYKVGTPHAPRKHQQRPGRRSSSVTAGTIGVTNQPGQTTFTVVLPQSSGA